MKHLSVTEYARNWNIPRPTVKRWCQLGQLPCYKVGRQYNIPDTATPPLLRPGRPRKPQPENADPATAAALRAVAVPDVDVEGE